MVQFYLKVLEKLSFWSYAWSFSDKKPVSRFATKILAGFLSEICRPYEKSQNKDLYNKADAG